MVLLITKTIVAQKLQVAIGYDTNEFNVFISEAQTLDFKPKVCEEFYFELLEKRNQPNWKKLIDGGEYLYNGRTYLFRGLADVLSYLSYARFILKSNNVSTSHGFVTKISPHSEPLSLEEKRNYYYKYQQDAFSIFEETKNYISRSGLYTSFFDCHSCGSGNGTGTGFTTKVIK